MSGLLNANFVAFLLLAMLPIGAAMGADYPAPVHGDFVIRDFHFADGEALPELKLHYFTLGTPERNAQGHITNAVLLLHGTGGSGTSFLTDSLAGELFGKGQPLDATHWYIIAPDSIGHGRSSRPSEGLRAKFPHYGYADMVEAQYRLMTAGLGIERLRAAIGTSMGCMHAWQWATAHPDSMEAVMPIACFPTQVAGRNRMERRLIVDAIRNDPEWKGGDYEKQPQGLTTALRLIAMSAGSVKQLYAQAPTQEATDRLLDRMVEQRMKNADANDLLYAWDASRDYDPEAKLPNIRATVLAVNFADDERNTAGLGIMERTMARVPHGRFVLVPESERTRGHASLNNAALWKEYLVELLERPGR
ncbi:MAG: alpha/beta fold hydrolase [Betaproteobacteria bacterium]